MSFFDKLSAYSPFSKKEEKVEYYFALNIGTNILTAALWVVKQKKLELIKTASKSYLSLEAIIGITDELLDIVLGSLHSEPKKILFGVPDSWLLGDNLKDEYLKLIKKIVKELELTPMAYVATSSALVNFLEKQQGMPVTAILIGFEKTHLEVILSQGGKVVGSRLVERSENNAVTIERCLLTFTTVETLPSKMLLFGEDREDLAKMRTNLLSHPWMSKLSFLHFPKIEILPDELEINSICLAGALEIEPVVSFDPMDSRKEHALKAIDYREEEIEKDVSEEEKAELSNIREASDFGFVVGDIAQKRQETRENRIEDQELIPEDMSLTVEPDNFVDTHQTDSFAKSHQNNAAPVKKIKFTFPKKFIFAVFLLLVMFAGLVAAYIFIPKAKIQVYVEPKTLEKEAQVIADPSVNKMDEEAKVIPAQTVNIESTGTQKAAATGERQIGDLAKGMVIIYNATAQGITLKAGTIITSDSGYKYSLDAGVNIASKSASAADPPTQSSAQAATATVIGPDSNIPSGSQMKVGSFEKSAVVAKTEGNFSGGTSKQVTVVSSDDQKKLLAVLSGELRKKAQESLQEKYPDKKILAEALNETITKKTYSKDINDQASEFSLTMTAKYTGSAFNELDLKTIVGKLVTTQVPEGFILDINQTETQADVSSIEKNGKVIFLAKFKARLLPVINTDDVIKKIKGKTLTDAENEIKNIANVLGSDIEITPALPGLLQRIPFIEKNISVSVGSK